VRASPLDSVGFEGLADPHPALSRRERVQEKRRR
jgi:hypothetical protein